MSETWECPRCGTIHVMWDATCNCTPPTVTATSLPKVVKVLPVVRYQDKPPADILAETHDMIIAYDPSLARFNYIGKVEQLIRRAKEQADDFHEEERKLARAVVLAVLKIDIIATEPQIPDELRYAIQAYRDHVYKHTGWTGHVK